MEQWRQVAARQHGVIRRGASDLSRHRADREIRLGGLVQPGRHALVIPTVATPDRALWAAVMEVGEPVALSGAAALWLYGIPIEALPPRPEALIPRRRASIRTGLARVHRVVPRELARTRTAHGLPVVSVPVAVRRAAAELPFNALLDVVEHVQRLRLTTPEQLTRALGHGLVGARALRAAIALVGPDSHSVWERRLAWLIRNARLPRPRRQAPVGSEPTYWVDFLFEPWRLAVEVDGFAAHSRPESFTYGLRRARRLVRHGVDVLAYAPVEIRDHPTAVIGEIAAALAERGAPLRSRRTS